MFDRLYKLVINHPSLDKGYHIIEGDSAKPSLGIQFRATISGGKTVTGASVRVIGLDTEIIQKIATFKRYRFSTLTSAQYNLQLSVAYRDYGRFASSYYPIINAAIQSATPGPLPERALSFSLCSYNNQEVVIQEQKIEKVLYSIEEFVKKLKEAFDEGTYGKFNKMVIKSDYQFGDGILLRPRMPTSVKEVGAFLTENGVPYVDKIMSDATGGCFQVCVVGAKDWIDATDDVESLTQTIQVQTPKTTPDFIMSESNGMIGLPRGVEFGADVDCILKKPYDLGSTFELKSVQMPYLSFNDYTLRKLTVSGDFYGDMWMQTLHLYRAGTVTSGKAS